MEAASPSNVGLRSVALVLVLTSEAMQIAHLGREGRGVLHQRQAMG